MGVLHPHPHSEHPGIGASKGNNRAIRANGSFEIGQKLDVIHGGLFRGEVDQVFLLIGLLLASEGHAGAEVSVFHVDYHAREVPGNVLVVESTIVVKHLDGSLVSAVEQDGPLAGRVPVFGVHEVLLAEGAQGLEVEVGDILRIVTDVEAQAGKVLFVVGHVRWEAGVHGEGHHNGHHQEEKPAHLRQVFQVLQIHSGW